MHQCRCGGGAGAAVDLLLSIWAAACATCCCYCWRRNNVGQWTLYIRWWIDFWIVFTIHWFAILMCDIVDFLIWLFCAWIWSFRFSMYFRWWCCWLLFVCFIFTVRTNPGHRMLEKFFSCWIVAVGRADGDWCVKYVVAYREMKIIEYQWKSVHFHQISELHCMYTTYLKQPHEHLYQNEVVVSWPTPLIRIA